jgi:ubiquinone/menaquinone biosynthesis C-methylase UbiE
MEQVRKPFRGVWNIIRFNRHFYITSACIIAVAIILSGFTSGVLPLVINILVLLASITIFISLLVSWYVYDVSDLYQFKWIEDIKNNKDACIVNINAGFDETSTLLKQAFPNAELVVYDFYDSERHTEISIKRARKAYPPFPGTVSVKTIHLPLADNYVDKIFIIFAAHEIRDEAERIIFFKELKRILKQNGQVIITEHLRDMPNFLAYNIGFFHFITRSSWQRVFLQSNFRILKEIKLTPFVSTFILEENGTTT